MKLRLAHVLSALLKYENNFKNGDYKNGNYKRVIVSYNGIGINLNHIDAHREYLEQPYYISKMYGYNNSVGHYSAEPYLMIVLEKEENKYV